MISMLDRMTHLFTRREPQLSIAEIESFAEYRIHEERTRGQRVKWTVQERELARADNEFQLRGYCYPCKKEVELHVDYLYAPETDGPRLPNWRERLVCSRCGLNNRLRGSIHMFDRFCSPAPEQSIYITEQTTPMYQWLTARYPNVTGSEYLGHRIPFGTATESRIRNESLTRLTFPDSQFDHILSFDVLEHIPDYQAALAECHRVLKPNGRLLLSVPFIMSAHETSTRAQISEAGEVEHLLPPEYHGDPLSNDGCLCFYHFGWDLLEAMKRAGFGSASALLYWSRDYGYLGGEQALFLATK